MFDKRLTALCPESKKYIFGNILLQFFELCLNVGMIVTIALTVQKLYDHAWTAENLPLPMLVILCTVVLRFFTTRYAVRMSYLASRTVKRVNSLMLFPPTVTARTTLFSRSPWHSGQGSADM